MVGKTVDPRTLYSILPTVEHPARYIGGEVNSVRKPFESTEFRFALAFPDTYEIGMSHLGLQVLYGLVNARPDSLAERVFVPWPDMAAAMKRERIPLFSLESKRQMGGFDVVGFTLQYEVCYATVLRMLDMAGIPRRRADRGDGGWPLLVAGGPCTFNPEPLAEVFDLFFIGDGEDTLPAFINIWKDHRANGRAAVVAAATREIRGIYGPELYRPKDGRMAPSAVGVPPIVFPAYVASLESAYFPTAPVIPFVQAVHERITLEIMRGCTRGCRFCQAGMTKRPLRVRSVARLLEQAEESYRHTGYDEISIMSLATGDYPSLLDLTRRLNHRFAPVGVGLSFPSLRADTALQVIPETMTEVRKGAITVAAESGSDRLRAVINKDITEEGIIGGLENAFKVGWNRVKLYFMVGLPTETLGDVDAIATLVEKILAVGRSVRRKAGVSCSIAPFVPKPDTPFQWEPMACREYLEEARRLLFGRLRGNPAVKVSFHNLDRSFLEGALARGGRETGPVLERAADLGCFLDAWDDYFEYAKWQEAFRSAGLDLEQYATRRLPLDADPAWAHISGGVAVEFLRREYEKCIGAALTPDCRVGGCLACGIDPAECRLARRQVTGPQAAGPGDMGSGTTV